MTRTIFGSLIGGIVGGVALFLVRFLFWGTPLREIALSTADATQSAQLQAALASALTQSGTGSYLIPNPSTDQGTVLFGQGPIALVHFNASGFPVVDSAALIAGLVLAIVVGLVMAAALRIVAARTPGFAERAQVAILMALAITLWTDIGDPIFNHAGWGYFIYLFLSDFIGLAAAGVVIARWFLPREVAAAPAARSV